jgi:hypothetical protein
VYEEIPHKAPYFKCMNPRPLDMLMLYGKTRTNGGVPIVTDGSLGLSGTMNNGVDRGKRLCRETNDQSGLNTELSPRNRARMPVRSNV